MLVAWWTFNSAGNQGGKLSATLRNLEMAPTLKYGASQKPQKSPGQMTTRPPGIWNEYGWSWVKGLIIGVGHLEHAPLKWWAWMGAAVKKQPSHLLHDSTLVGGWTAPTTFANWIHRPKWERAAINTSTISSRKSFIPGFVFSRLCALLHVLLPPSRCR